MNNNLILEMIPKTAVILSSINLIRSIVYATHIGAASATLCAMTTILCANITIYKSKKIAFLPQDPRLFRQLITDNLLNLVIFKKINTTEY